MPRPLLVLAHGTRFDATSWVDYAPLVPEADVVAVDLPGHGTRAGQEYTTQAAVDILDAAVREVGPEREVVVAGHSLGGYVTAAWAQAHPTRPSAIVLIGATADPSRHPVLVHAYSGFAALLPIVGAQRMARFANGVMRRLGASADMLPDATGYAATPAAWAAVVTESGPHQLRGLRCPVFLVAGQFDQLRIDMGAYARECHDPRIRVVRGASHLAPITHRDAVAGVLREAVAAVR